MTKQEFVKPEIGEGATLHYPSDSYPYVVVSTSATGKTVDVLPVRTVDRTTGHEPAYFNGPWPVWSHTYTPEELQELKREGAQKITVRYTKNGWTAGGSRFTMGKARYHRNYAD